MPQARCAALPKHQSKDRLGTNKDTTNATYEITEAQTKQKKLQQRSRLRMVSKKKNYWERVRVEGLKLVSRAQNFDFYFDAVPNYKYTFGPHMGPLPHP